MSNPVSISRPASWNFSALGRRLLAALATLLSPLAFAQQAELNEVIVYDLCDYRDHGATLPPGDYTARELVAQGIPEDAISAVQVPRGWVVTLYEDDLFQGRYGTLRGDNPCLADNRFDNTVSSLSIREALDIITPSSPPAKVAVKAYSRCGFKGEPTVLAPGDYNLSQLRMAGIEDNTLAALEIPPGLAVTLYEHDFMLGQAGRASETVACLDGTRFARQVTSLTVEVTDPSRINTTTANRTAPVQVWDSCGYRGTAIALEAGEYTEADLQEHGIANNSISAIKVAEGYAVELYKNNFFLGTRGVLRQDDDCLANDRFDNTVSSLKIIRLDSATPQQAPRAPVPPARRDSAPRAPVSSTQNRAPSLEELLPPPPGSAQSAGAALEKGMACVERFVEAGQCQSQNWRAIVRECRLEQIKLMNDGYLRGHVDAGNCQARYWPELARRVANTRLR